ncbi:hypothetical protein RFI_39868 [Reticulomyxa filosa]|uniref:Uncharacterized protein n=1 Tax=Reticulomyxa filosa TaxID=46433 RepID=X6L861_RETFI|nr:hypothetical protein RFI_39868 [Reticulomyxa filosa]|eukprot:ETN97660.1 hypothetical protein RFI_39868 [Reticulomyxa filosa]
MSVIDHPKNDIPFGTIDDVRGSGHMPLIQTSAQVQKENYITVYMNPPPATTCMSNGTLTWFDLQPRIAQNVKTIDIRLNITCSNAKVTTTPAPYWFRTIRIRLNKGSGDYVQWIYPENIVMHYALMDPIRRKWYEDHGMIKFYEYKEHYRFVYPNPLEVNETRDVYIPIPTSYWDMGAIHFQHMSQDIRIEFEFDSDFVISGTATNITVNNIAAVINQFDLTGDEQEMWLRDFQSSPHYYNYLDCIRVTDNSKTMTQSAKTNFDVQNFIAKSPFLLVCIKPSTAPIASDHSKYRPLDWGDGATVEMENPSNEPLLGKGNAPKWEYLEKRFVELTGKKPIRGFYIINFTQSIYDSYNGVIKGFYPFAGVKDTLAITFGGAGIQETSTLTPDAAPTAGRFHVMFDGRELGTVAYNASAATLAAAINGSDPFVRTGQTVSSNATVSAGTAITLTWSVGDGNIAENFGDKVPCLLGDALADHYFASANGKNGKPGWTTSSSRQIEIYCMIKILNGVKRVQNKNSTLYIFFVEMEDVYSDEEEIEPLYMMCDRNCRESYVPERDQYYVNDDLWEVFAHNTNPKFFSDKEQHMFPLKTRKVKRKNYNIFIPNDIWNLICLFARYLYMKRRSNLMMYEAIQKYAPREYVKYYRTHGEEDFYGKIDGFSAEYFWGNEFVGIDGKLGNVFGYCPKNKKYVWFESMYHKDVEHWKRIKMIEEKERKRRLFPDIPTEIEDIIIEYVKQLKCTEFWDENKWFLEFRRQCVSYVSNPSDIVKSISYCLGGKAFDVLMAGQECPHEDACGEHDSEEFHCLHDFKRPSETNIIVKVKRCAILCPLMMM